ncbi:MAG TPA: DNA repair protein RecO [Patescibacteria group bacterium]|nr:DNA repair protein RecO [Patescibacteria group bacterium]
MYTLKTEGVIIKRRNVNEADKLITVLTRTNGKLQIKAPGVRKIASRRSPHIELLNRSFLTLYVRYTTPVLTEAQMVSDYKFIKQDLLKIGYAYHICEITDGLCAEGQENETVFELLIATLDNLCATSDPFAVVHDFELDLLETLGFGTAKMRTSEYFNIHAYIESLLEKKLRSKDIFLQKESY